jgi:phage terminase large subunit
MTLLMETPLKSKKSTRSESLANLALCREDFALFGEKVLGLQLYDYQKEILRAISTPGTDRVVWHKGHGVGGTTTMAVAAIAFCFTRSMARVITTASVNRQVRDVLWPEIHHRMRGFKKDVIGWKWNYSLLDMKLEILDDWFILGASSDQPGNMEGQHADHMLYIVDEAKTVERGIFEAIEGALTGTIEAKILVVSTPPMAKEGHFFDLCSGKFPSWKVFHTPCWDSPNVSKDWIAQRAIEWGEESPVFISKVAGQFPDSSDDTVIPFSWVEKAEERWSGLQYDEASTIAGVDVARYGSDSSVIAILRGRKFMPLMSFHKQETMATVGQVVRAIRNFKIQQVNVDVIGVGAGVFDRLKEQAKELGVAVRPVDAASKAPTINDRGEIKRFRRLKDYLWWHLRMRLDPDSEDPIGLPPSEKLRSQLTSIRYTIKSDGVTEVESKDQLKARGYSSPDEAEAIVLALHKPYEGWTSILK